MNMKINSQPEECTIYFTDVCNFSCSGCSRQTVGKPKHKEMDVETIEKVLNAYPSIESFCIAGLGEPTLGKHFQSVVNYLLDKGKYVGIITNGTHPERLMQLTKNPSYISISLYGINNKEYNEWTRVNAFESVKQNYAVLKKRFINVGFSYILNKDNYKKLEDVIKLCDELKPSFLNLVNYLVYDSKNENDVRKIITIDDVDIIKYIEEKCDSRSYIKIRPIYIDKNDSEFYCSSYEKVINVDGYGNIGGCQRQINPGIEYGSFSFTDDPYNSVPMQMLRNDINENIYPHDNCIYCFGRYNSSRIREKVLRITGTTNKSLAIALLFHEKVEQTIECIQSFLPSKCNIYVLNNGSSEESTIRLKDFAKGNNQIKILDAGKNLGVGVGRNYLIENTKEDWLFFVDNDIYVTNNEWINEFAVHQSSYPSIEVFIPKLFNLHENKFVHYQNIGIKDNHIITYESKNKLINNFPGGASIVKRTLFERLGKYDNQMFVGLEDFEFVLRGVINNTPVRAMLVDTIELVHDHRKIENKVDKSAVLVRYDETLIQKSFDRMQQKYHDLDVRHEWRTWVAEQKNNLVEYEKYDLSLLTEEKNYGVKAKARTFVVKNKSLKPNTLSDYEISFIKENIEQNNYSGILLFQNVENKSIIEVLSLNKLLYECYNSITTSPTSKKINYDGYIDFEIMNSSINTEKPVIIILDHILEKVEDPRYLLSTVKNILLKNTNSKLLILTKERDNNGIEVPTDESSFREWKQNELEAFILATGISIIKSKKNISENGNQLLFELSLAKDEYNVFLKEVGLPDMNIHYLICSNEHGKAKLSGGIGSYVEEAQKIFSEKELGVFLIGKGNLLPDNNILYENKLISFKKFFDQNTIHINDISEILLKSIQVIQLLYPYLQIIEIQDVEGYGVRLTQAKRNGMIKPSITIQICAHGNKIQMERVYEEWLDPLDYETMYKEKIAIENADKVIFPTGYIKKLYEDAGVNINSEKSFNLRLPFTYKSFPVNKYSDIDTMIFYGKRLTVKGYDIFAEIVAQLDMHRIIGTKIKRIIMIGPKFTEMQKINDYFESLKKRIEIIEISTTREEAIKIIEENYFRALCILPYKSDNHPYSLMEIVQTGCSFVISNTGGVLEMIPEKYYSYVTSDLVSKKFFKSILDIISETNDSRYNLFSSIYKEMKDLQETINYSYRIHNGLMNINGNGNIYYQKCTLTLIATLSEKDNIYNNHLITAVNNQTTLPDKVIFIYKNDDINNNLITDKIQVRNYEMIKYENYKTFRNELLNRIKTELIAFVKQYDIPLNNFVNSCLGYLSDNKNYDCVSTYSIEYSFSNEIVDNSLSKNINKPYGEWGLLNYTNKNYYGLGSFCFRTKYLCSLNGWDENELNDDLSTFYKIRSNKTKIGIVCKPLIIRVKQDCKRSDQRNFFIEKNYASNYYQLDKFDSHRISGLIQSSTLGKVYRDKSDIPELEKYLITAQILLVNNKIIEASEILNNINKNTFDRATKELQNKIKRIRNKTEVIINKTKQVKQIQIDTEKPLVSVIIPTMNRPEQLYEAIQSVLNQSYQNFEIHVVNDAGCDVSTTIKAFNDQRIFYHKHNKNKGLAAARNTGIKNSKGIYIALLDDDDLFYNDHLEITVAELLKGNKVVYTDAIRCTYKNVKGIYLLIKKNIPYSIEYDRNKLLLSNISPVNCFVFSKELIKKCGLFNPEYKVLEDWEYWLRLSKQTDFYHIKKATVQVTWKDDGSTMTSSKQKLFQKFREKIYSEYSHEYEAIPNQNEIIAEYRMIWDDDYKPIVSIVIPTYNQLNFTKEFIDSLYSNTKIPFELIVIINNRNDGTEEYLKEISNKYKFIKTITNIENVGFPISVNQGILTSTCENIAIVNNDIVVTANWLEKLLHILNTDPQIGLVGPISNEVSGLQKDENAKYNSIEEMHKYAAEVSEKNKGEVLNFPRIAFLCTLIKREVIEKIGGLDERFSPGNYEDDDFCLRAQLAGYKTVIAKDVFIHHYGSKSFKANGIEAYKKRLEINKQIFIEKWGITPDDLWLKNKPIKEHSILYPINKNLFKQYFDRTQIHLNENELELAKASVQKAVANFREGDNAVISFDELCNIAGNIHLAVNDAEKAKEYFEMELNTNPSSSSACKGLGDVFLTQENFEAAKTMYEWAVKNDPNNQNAVESLGNINELLGYEVNHISAAE